MPLVAFHELMSAAEAGGYAVGYFESWNLESLLAVADAAAARRSPVILGFSGIYLPHPGRVVQDPLAVYAALGLATCRQLSVPACLLFNESPHRQWVFDAIDLGFNLVMFSDETLPAGEQLDVLRDVCDRAHDAGCAVEAEIAPLPGVGGDLAGQPDDLRLTDPQAARAFVKRTGVDCLAINVGQLHLHGRRQVPLDLDRLSRIRDAVGIPLALHGASSVRRDDLPEAVRRGVRKVNFGSVLKQAYFAALRAACDVAPTEANPYEVVGSGMPSDVLTAGRLSVCRVVEQFMSLLGSADRTPKPKEGAE